MYLRVLVLKYSQHDINVLHNDVDTSWNNQKQLQTKHA